MSSGNESNGYTYTSSGGDSADTDEYDDIEGKTLTFREKRRGCLPVCCNAQRFSHCCYVCQFMLFLLVFPLWAKWLLVSPMPREYWHSKYAPFPLVEGDFDSDEMLQDQMQPKIQMSAIPESSGRCNYSCSAWRGYRTEEMNFRVSLSLNDSALTKAHAHTVYPVLLASADFQDWWVVGDKRFAHPTPFWSEHTAKSGVTYVKASPSCTRPPAPQALPQGLSATYVMGCVTWSNVNLRKLADATEVSDAQLAELCDAVGGVCGWSCGSRHSPLALKGCDANGRIEVSRTSFAGQTFPNADFKGKVSLRQCPEVDEYGECLTKEDPFQKWDCHNCKYNPNEIEEDAFRRLQIIPGLPSFPGLPGGGGLPGIGGGGGIPGIDPDGGLPAGLPGSGLSGEDAKSSYIYTSLPMFEVSVTGLGAPDSDQILSHPAVVVFETNEQKFGSWSPLYQAYAKTRPPVAVDSSGDPLVKGDPKDEDDMDESRTPSQDGFSRHGMHLRQGNRLTMEPTWCYGKQGPLYLVACAVNSSLYHAEGFKGFEAGQKTAPPPFNDRCIEVSGRCGHACMIDQPTMANCTADGRILQSALVGHEEFETAKSTPLLILCVVLIICFSIKVLVLCPGIFWPYTHYRRYDPELTEHLRFINVCVPSDGESKPVTLRSLIGAIGSMPKDCNCRFHVTLTDDGHRLELLQMFRLLTKVIEAIPGSSGGLDLNENVRNFFLVWVECTKKVDISKLRDNALEELEKESLEWLSGRSTFQTLRENSWSSMDARALQPLDEALAELHQALLTTDSDTFSTHRDSVVEWEPKKRNALPLRLHYLARAMPAEDERTVKTQHVAPGIYYYKVPINADDADWLSLRAGLKEMVYGLEEQDHSVNLVPVHTSRGQPGALNFATNFLFNASSRPENVYGDSRDHSPCLFSICDPYHQFQPDFFHTTIPRFFDRNGELDEEVGFAQCPLYFFTLEDELDYLDGNSANFFRFHSMLQNCCGGVNAWGTNSTRLLSKEADESLWVAEKSRVRLGDKKRTRQLIERKFFPETCKVEHIASSVNEVLNGRRSQFINRRLSYGVSRSGTDSLASMQRSAEGNVVFWLQSFFGRQGITLWLTLAFFIYFLVRLCILVTNTTEQPFIVRMGLVDDDLLDPLIDLFKRFVELVGSNYFGNKPALIKIYVTMLVEFVIWLAGSAATLLLVFLVTECLKACTACGLFACDWVPNEMRHWARLLIRMHQTSSWVWFWLPFFWIGFNYWNIFADRTYHFNCLGMFLFIVTLQVLNWGMVVAASLRSSLQASMETNEVIFLSMDSIWRSTQTFYVTAPLQLYAFIKAVEDWMRYHFYGEDITFQRASESRFQRAETSMTLIKYWTLLLLLGAVGAWVRYATTPRIGSGALAPCIVVTLIALDVLHPCAYLWVGQSKHISEEKARSLSWLQACFSSGWWSRWLSDIVLNRTLTRIIKWIGPISFVVLPFLILVMPYMGVNLAFTMLLGATSL